MGECFIDRTFYPPEKEQAVIRLNQVYLLNKFGCDKYFVGDFEYGDYTYLDISFKKMLKTCSHELAHYIQYVKYGRSSCESDLKLGNGKYDALLAREHKEIRRGIFQLMRKD
jgi:hypothetical protein